MTLCSPWATLNNLTECGCPDADALVAEFSLDSASEIMFALTGHQYPGTCETTLRPCSSGGSMVSTPFGPPWVPMRVGGNWLNLGGCGCHIARDCACNGYPRVNLGRSDVQSIEAVTIDDEVLDPDAYRLDENHYLVRVDGGNWPCCQDLSLNSGTGTWSIDLTYGWPLPQSLVRAAAVLAMEFVKACTGDASCRLPAGTQSVVKQGITIELNDPQIFLTQGRTGIYEVDLAIKAVNPNGIVREALVRSPEVRSAGLWG